jgi:hypothetical protein
MYRIHSGIQTPLNEKFPDPEDINRKLDRSFSKNNMSIGFVNILPSASARKFLGKVQPTGICNMPLRITTQVFLDPGMTSRGPMAGWLDLYVSCLGSRLGVPAMG